MLFIVGGKSSNTDNFETFRAFGDSLREYFACRGPTPIYVVVARGGPNIVRGMGVLADACGSLALPYRFFGFDAAISEAVLYACRLDTWMREGGRSEIAVRLGLAEQAAPAAVAA